MQAKGDNDKDKFPKKTQNETSHVPEIFVMKTPGTSHLAGAALLEPQNGTEVSIRTTIINLSDRIGKAEGQQPNMSDH